MRRVLRWVVWALVVVAAAVDAHAVVVDGVAAVVDRRVITRSEVAEAATMLRQTGASADADAEKLALDKLVERALVEQEAARLGIEVTDEEVEQAICDICERNNLDRDKLPEALAAQGLDYDAYVAQVRAQLRQMKLVSRVLRARMSVSDMALREFYLKNVPEFRDPDAVHLYHIQFPEGTSRERVEAVRARVLAGEPFQDLARLVSVGPAAVEGGDMGFLPVGSLAGGVAAAIEGLGDGQVSRPVELLGTLHLFYVDRRQKGRIPTFEEVRDRVQARYFKEREQELFRSWIESLREKARIEVKM